MTIVSENILTIRGKLSQEEFGILIDANKNKVYTYEKHEGASVPKRHVLQKIANYAGISIDDLLNKKINASDLSFQTSGKNIEEQIVAINAQLKVLFLKIIELETKNPFEFSTNEPSAPYSKKSATEANLELANLIKRETKRMMDELRVNPA